MKSERGRGEKGGMIGSYHSISLLSDFLMMKAITHSKSTRMLSSLSFNHSLPAFVAHSVFHYIDSTILKNSCQQVTHYNFYTKHCICFTDFFWALNNASVNLKYFISSALMQCHVAVVISLQCAFIKMYFLKRIGPWIIMNLLTESESVIVLIYVLTAGVVESAGKSAPAHR